MNKILQVILIVLATLGVLFIILMLWPEGDDDEVASQPETQEAAVAAPIATDNMTILESTAEAESNKAESEAPAPKETESSTEAEETLLAENSGSGHEDNGNNATVTIPQSELSRDTLRFKTVSLDNEKLSQDIFSNYDLTIVHVWGTFCNPCIREMGDYARLYKELPDNVNLVGLICDVYDGIDSNVSDAEEILGNADAEFLNMRSSDDLYDITADINYVPSSFFVDREGHMVGKIMDGAGFDETKKQLEKYLE